jgi:hypothetical protein
MNGTGGARFEFTKITHYTNIYSKKVVHLVISVTRLAEITVRGLGKLGFRS